MTLTDLNVQEEVVQDNIALNRDSFEGCGCIVRFRPLPFGDSLDRSLIEGNISSQYYPIDVILGADIGYDISLHQPIVETLKSLTAEDAMLDSNTYHYERIILLAEEIRWKDIFCWYKDTICEAFDSESWKISSQSMSAHETISSDESNRPVSTEQTFDQVCEATDPAALKVSVPSQVLADANKTAEEEGSSNAKYNPTSCPIELMQIIELIAPR